MTDTPEFGQLDMASPDGVSRNIEQIAALFPNCVTETAEGKKIDFDLLKQELSHDIVEGTKERYRLEWAGKREAIVTANIPTTNTLRPLMDNSVNFDETKNLFIEGDNLEVLKLLQESYLGEIKMIYIDPPYNTGGDFVYKDNFIQQIDVYNAQNGFLDEYQKRLIANPESSGRYHSDWLSMMYSRLKLAKNLLNDEGVIFISIDDSEIHNLRKICDEIFGEGQFVGTFPWRSRTAKADVPFGVSQDVEWVVAYANKDFIAGREGARRYYKSDDFEDRWRLQDLTTNKSKQERPNSYFTMINPKSGQKFEANPLRTWSVTTDTFSDYYNSGKIVFPGDYDFLKLSKPAYRVFEQEDKNKALHKYGSEEVRMSISTYLPENEVGRTENGSKQIRELFGVQVFSYPKPIQLIEFFIKNISSPSSIILDFFAGSATTAEAIMKQNALDGGSRQYILVQLPEALNTDKAEQRVAGEFCEENSLPPLLTEISKERIRRAAKKIKEETNADIDYGFRVYRLDSSNMQDVYYNPQNISQQNLELFADNIKPDRTADDLVTQIMLDWGLPLSLPVERMKVLDKEVIAVAGNSLFACFDSGIDEVFAKEIATRQPLRIVFRDRSFANDTAKENVRQLLKQLSPATEMRVL